MPVRGLLLMLVTLLLLLIIRVSVSSVAHGWILVATMLTALCFVTIAAVGATRAR